MCLFKEAAMVLIAVFNFLLLNVLCFAGICLSSSWMSDLACFSFGGRERDTPFHHCLSQTGQNPALGPVPLSASTPCLQEEAPGLRVSFLGQETGLLLGAGQHSLPWNHVSVFPVTPKSQKASISSLVVQSGLACSLSRNNYR